jgi:MFS family permease
MRLVQGDRVILTIFVFLAVTGLGEGVIVTLLPAFVKEVLRGGALELGWLMSAQAVGGLIGGLVVGYAANALTPSRLLGLSAVAIGLIDLTIFNYPAFFSGITLGLILFVVVGVPVTGVLTSLYTLLQNATEDRYRGRVFGAFDTTQALLILVGTLVGGALGDVIGVVVVLNVQGGAYVLAGILVLMLLAGASVRKAEPSTENRRTGSAG